MTRRLAAIMYTDVVGFTASAQANESDALARLREQEGIVRPLFEPFKGRAIKSTGDGFLVEFESALGALECAVEIQRRMRERNTKNPRAPLELRIGIHVGDVEESGGDIFGDAVNVASRIVPLANPGGVCLSGQVFDQVQNKVALQLDKLSAPALKGVRGRMDVYRVVLPWGFEDRSEGGSALPRIAVLPLANISPDPKDEYFADGLTEELITVLSQLKGLRVVSRTSVNQYRGASKSVAQIGTELGADSVLEGSVRKAGDQLRIAVQLIDTRTDEHRWAQTYDRKLENVFAIQADVAERAASALKVELLRSEREVIQERPTSNFAAYEAYLRGIQASQRSSISSSPELDQEAVSHFEKAIQEDPRFAAAHARLANHLITSGGSTRPWTDVVGWARDLASKALELDPNSSEAHMAQGNVALQADRDWNRAEAEFQQSIALNPSNSLARSWYALLLEILQRHGEVKKQLQAAIEQDPLNIEHRVFLVNAHWAAGELGAAETLLERLVKDFPVHANAWSREGLALLYAWTGKSSDAMRMIEPLASATDVGSRLYHAQFMALMGRPEEARALLAEWEAGRFAERLMVGNLGELCACMGDYERALALLERSARQGEPALPFHYEDAEFDPIRDDPRFVALLRELNLPTTLARPRWSPKPRTPT